MTCHCHPGFTCEECNGDSIDDVVLDGVQQSMLAAFAKCAAIADEHVATLASANGRIAARMIAAKIREEAGKLRGG